MTDWQHVREKFPALKKSVYLNTAGGCALSSQAAAAGKQYFDEMLNEGDLLWPTWLERTEAIRAELAKFINCKDKDVAFLPNASLGMNYAERILAPGAGVLLVHKDFPSVTMPWLRPEREQTFVSSSEHGIVTIDAIDAALTARTKCLAVGHVNYSSGFRFDLDELGTFCRKKGLFSIVDVTQSFGAYPIDVTNSKIDCIVLSGYKWSTAGYGVGAIYLRQELLKDVNLPAMGWRSAQVPYKMLYDRLELSTDTTALELGHPPFPGIFALGGALQLLNELGIEIIRERIEQLNDYLHNELDKKGITIASTRDTRQRSGITMIDCKAPDYTVQELKKRGIFVSVRGGLIRASLHFYNNERDIDFFVGELARLIS